MWLPAGAAPQRLPAGSRASVIHGPPLLLPGPFSTAARYVIQDHPCVYLTQPAMASSSRTIDGLDVIPARSVWCPVALAGGGEQGAAARGLQACALTESALFFGQPQGCVLALVKAL